MKFKHIKKYTIFSALFTLFFIFTFSIESFCFGPSSNQIFQGIDVSSWQGDIDFSAVKNSGIDIVYIKSSEGSNYINPYFESSYSNAKANGLKVGFYHYVTARTTQQAIEEANFFARVIRGKSPDCKLPMHFENFGNLSISQINEISITFLETLENVTNSEAVIYSNAYSARTIFSDSLTKYPLWVANYGVSQPEANGKWNTWVGWQYTSTGSVNGVSGYVDRNQFTDGVLLSSTSPLPSPEVPETPSTENTILYTVKRGDTLSEIAMKFGTTVSSIVALNPSIKNPNLIYPGQQFTIQTNANTSQIEDTVYIVKSGDTLSEIALKYGTTVNSLVQINQIKNKNLIYPGERIIIRSSNTISGGQNSCGKILYQIKWGDTLSELAIRYHSTVEEIAKINNIANPNLIYAGTTIRIPNCR